MLRQIEHIFVVVTGCIMCGILGYIVDTFTGMWISWIITLAFMYVLALYIKWAMCDDFDV